MLVLLSRNLPRLRLCRRKHTNGINEAPLYSRKPSLLVRWAYGLMACNVVFAANAGYLTWTRWTMRVDPPEGSDSASSSHELPATYVLRPSGHRLALIGAQLLGCAGAVTVLFGLRTRSVSALHITRPNPSSPARRVFVQPYGKPEIDYRLEDCALRVGVGQRVLVDTPGRGRTRKGEGGEMSTWVVELDNASIRGQPSSVEEARKALFRAWDTQNEDTTRARKSGRWTTGPMADAAAERMR